MQDESYPCDYCGNPISQNAKRNFERRARHFCSLRCAQKGKARRPIEDRFWPKVVEAPTGCWEWTGSKTELGYGRINSGGQWGRVLPAHRVAYELVVGKVPAGLELDHLCRNPSCVNPAHLEAVTHQENCRRHHALKTHCPHGHPYSGDNVAYQGGGRWRYCRVCVNKRANRRYHERAQRG